MQQLPSEDVWISFGIVEYFIPADWVGKNGIVSKCGWWIGEVRIVIIDGARYIDWFYAYSLKFDGGDCGKKEVGER